jgi:hypothetical protein
MKKKKASEISSEEEPDVVSMGKSLWQQAREEQKRRFDEQSSRNQRSYSPPRTADAGSYKQSYPRPSERISAEEFNTDRQSLVDLLNAGIIDRQEYDERLAELIKEAN